MPSLDSSTSHAACQALLRLPSLRPPHGSLGQNHSRAHLLLRSLARLARGLGPLPGWRKDLEAGHKPRRPLADGDVLTVGQMVRLFLAARRLDVENLSLEERTWKEYESYGKRLVRVLGNSAVVQDLGPADFQKLKADFQKTHASLVTLKGDIRKTKVIFNWAGPGERGSGFTRVPSAMVPFSRVPRPRRSAANSSKGRRRRCGAETSAGCWPRPTRSSAR